MSNHNSIEIKQVICENNKITYDYVVNGQWSETFNLKEKFFVEYNINVDKCPYGIAVIPMLSAILPLSWICDAQIVIEECDKDFFESIPEFKQGYIDMYPMINFKGSLEVNKTVDNAMCSSSESSACLFSGGVDAFNTFFVHEAEKPELITIWGADVKLNNPDAWDKVYKHTKETAEKFGVNFRIIKSNFRTFISELYCDSLVKKSPDAWWHGFHHAISMLGMCAPVAFADNLKRVYIASSYTKEEREIVTCASDPTIDNYVRYCGTRIIHDGFELNRQEKVHNIISFADEKNTDVNVRVCWQSSDGENCCKCEKCWRTIFEILAENGDPERFGFHYSKRQARNSRRIYYQNLSTMPSDKSWYRVAQQIIRSTRSVDEWPKELRWFYETEVDDFWNKAPKWFSLLQRFKYFMRSRLGLLKRFLIKLITR